MPRDYFRAFERRATNLAARLSPVGEPLQSARLLNLCLGGACLRAETRIDVGTQVRLEIDVPNLWAPLRLPARVVWSRGASPQHEIGVCFQFDDARVGGWLLDVLGSNAYN